MNVIISHQAVNSGTISGSNACIRLLFCSCMVIFTLSFFYFLLLCSKPSPWRRKIALKIKLSILPPTANYTALHFHVTFNVLRSFSIYPPSRIMCSLSKQCISSFWVSADSKNKKHLLRNFSCGFLAIWLSFWLVLWSIDTVLVI